MQGQGRPNVPGHATGTVEVVVMCRKRLADALAVLEVELRRSEGGSLAEMMQSGWHAAIRQGSAFTGCTGTVTTGTADKGYQCSLYLSNNGQSRGRTLPIEHKNTPDQHGMLPCHGAQRGTHGRPGTAETVRG